jgi:hypothetical protein
VAVILYPAVFLNLTKKEVPSSLGTGSISWVYRKDPRSMFFTRAIFLTHLTNVQG